MTPAESFAVAVGIMVIGALMLAVIAWHFRKDKNHHAE